MIRSFRHKGLKRFHGEDVASRVHASLRERIREILTALDTAETLGELDLPGYRLHPLKGNLKNFWSITVSGNWRIAFRFEKGSAYDVDLLDYH